MPLPSAMNVFFFVCLTEQKTIDENAEAAENMRNIFRRSDKLFVAYFDYLEILFS